MGKRRYHLTIKLYNGEKIETVVTASIINYLLAAHKNIEKFSGLNFMIEINGREILIKDIDYFMWHVIMEEK